MYRAMLIFVSLTIIAFFIQNYSVNNIKDKCLLSEDEDIIPHTKKEKQKLKLLKSGNSVKMNDRVIRYLTTKNNQHLSSTGITGKIPVLIIFPFMVLIFLLLMIYL